MVALAAFRLVERGVLKLDLPLAESLAYPRLEHEPRYKQITPRHVLSHTTGLPNWGGDRLDLRFDPGDRFSYSGKGFVFLQKVLEKTLGKGLQEILAQEVFLPLNMTSSSVIWRDSYRRTAARGHDDWGQVQDLRKRDKANGAASLMTTATDYGRFVAGLLSRPLISSESWEKMFSPAISAKGWGSDTPESQAHIDWGLGWSLEETGSTPRFWHWGDNGSFKCLVMADPDSKNGFVYFTNSSAGLSIAATLIEHFFPEGSFIPSFLDYETFDSPERALRHRLVDALSDHQGENPWAEIEKSLERSPRPEIDLYHSVSRQLRELAKPAEAVRVLEIAVQKLPPKPWSAEDLGDAQVEARMYQKAHATYARTVAGPAAPEIKARLQRKMTWAEERRLAGETPVVIPNQQLRRFVGQYGPRQIRFEGEHLIYQREGNRSYVLLPLSQNTFALLGLETFRLRFELGTEGQAHKVVGLYLNGNHDESVRTGS